MHKTKEFIEKNGWMISHFTLFALAILSISIFLKLTDIGYWISLVFISLIKDCGEYKALTEILEKNDKEIKKASKTIGFLFKHLYFGLVAIYLTALIGFPTGFLTKEPLEIIPITEGQFYLGLCLLGLAMNYTAYKMTMEKEKSITQEIKHMQSENSNGTIEKNEIQQVYETIKEQFTETSANCARKWVSTEYKFEKTARKTAYPLIFECLKETNETVLYFPDFPEFIIVVKSVKKEDILFHAKAILPEYIEEYKTNRIILPWASDIESIKAITGIDSVVMIPSTGGKDE